MLRAPLYPILPAWQAQRQTSPPFWRRRSSFLAGILCRFAGLAFLLSFALLCLEVLDLLLPLLHILATAQRHKISADVAVLAVEFADVLGEVPAVGVI